jgi:hypothetical protein
MGLFEKTQPKESSSKPGEDFSLDKAELETLLLIIKDTMFRGEHVETIYSIVYKLQQQYLEK